MKNILMCGGSYPAWDEPRQLLKVKGERIVERTIRLLKAAGVDDGDIYISSHDRRFAAYAPVLVHDNDYVGYSKDGGYWVDAFYPTQEPACYIMGDVVFSPAAIRTIVEKETDRVDFFASSPPFDPRYAKRWAEPFAFKVTDQIYFRQCVNEVKRLQDAGVFHRRPIAWELWQVAAGTALNCIMYYNYTTINDYTCDVDDIEDIALIERWVE